jgi:hypothetical protein
MLKSDVGNSFVRAVELVHNYWRVVEFPDQPRAARPVPAGAARDRVERADTVGVL